jgi:hypothetical protein
MPSSVLKTNTVSTATAGKTRHTDSSYGPNTEHSTQPLTNNTLSPLQAKALDTIFDKIPAQPSQQPALVVQMDAEAPPFHPATAIVSIDEYTLDSTELSHLLRSQPSLPLFFSPNCVTFAAKKQSRQSPQHTGHTARFGSLETKHLRQDLWLSRKWVRRSAW